MTREVIREEMALAELSKKYGVHLLSAAHAKHVWEAAQIGTWIWTCRGLMPLLW